MAPRVRQFVVVCCAGAWLGLGALVLTAGEPPPGPPPVPVPAEPGAGAADAQAAELDRRFGADVAPLLARYCVSCHSGDEPKGDLHLDRLAGIREVLSGDLDARKLKEMVSTGEMPPKKARREGAEPPAQPSDHERLAISQWADDAAAYVPPDAAVDPGWCTPHRLNRSEYRNTLRDLIGVDPKVVDLAAKLPRDDTGYGFDNIADVLSVSPLAVEQYLSAAERAVEVGLGPVVEFGDHPVRVRPLEGTSGQPLPSGGFFLYSNGPAAGRYTAAVGGEYLVRVRAWETHGGDENAKMALRVGKRQVKEFSVSGTRQKPQEFSVKVRLTAGEHSIAGVFLNDYYVKDKADRNLGVEWISVAGPLDGSPVERPAAWKQVFGVAGVGKSDTERAEAVVSAFASRAYRRPQGKGDATVQALMKVYAAERKGGRVFEPAVRTALTAALVSPNFLFRTVASPGGVEGRRVLDAYELASRLSYFLWSSMPDEALFAAAADGSLLKDDVLSAQVKRMIADAKADAFIENFSGQWLELRALEAVAIDKSKFPAYDDSLRSAMTGEATLFFGGVLRGDKSVLEFVDSRETYLNAALAELYGVPGVSGDRLQRVTLPRGSPRGGVLTMGAVLTLTSNTTRTSPVKRGKFVLDQMLGAPPPPPPPDVPPLDQSTATDPNATVRERLAAHVANPTCASCHTRLDPLGLSMEHFDAIGRWRDTENGKPVDATGTLPGGARLDGAADLKKSLLARSDQFVEALCAKVLTYALGRGAEPFDRPAVRRIAQRTRANGDRLSALVESVVLSDSFRTCRGRKADHD